MAVTTTTTTSMSGQQQNENDGLTTTPPHDDDNNNNFFVGDSGVVEAEEEHASSVVPPGTAVATPESPDDSTDHVSSKGEAEEPVQGGKQNGTNKDAGSNKEEDSHAVETNNIDDEDSTNNKPIQNLFQKRAANVISNFRAGFSLQQEQRRQSKLVRERMVERHHQNRKNEDGDDQQDGSKICKEEENEDGGNNDNAKQDDDDDDDDGGMKTEDRPIASQPASATNETSHGGGGNLLTTIGSFSPSHSNKDDDDEGAMTKRGTASVDSKTQSNKNQSSSSPTISPAGVLDLPTLLSTSPGSATPNPTNGKSTSTNPTIVVPSPSSSSAGDATTGRSPSSASFSPSMMFLGGAKSSLLSSLKTTPKYGEEKEVEEEGVSTNSPNLKDREVEQEVEVEDEDHDDDAEVAHELLPFTYKKPTSCDICDGLLVGLWHQGLRCKYCGINVHHGEGAVNGLNCRAEALLQEGGCRRHHELMKKRSSNLAPEDNGEANDLASPNPDSNNVDSSSVSLKEAVQQVRQMARERPSFLRDVKAQIDRDVKSRVKSIIVSQGAEEQRSKSLVKFRTEYVIPTTQILDRIESYGWKGPYAILFGCHFALTVLISIFAWAGTAAAMYGGEPNAKTVRYDHNVTILYFFHLALAIAVIIVRRLITMLHRRSRVLDQFILQVFSLSSADDIGITMQQLASRLRLWIRRITITTSTMLLLSLVVYRWSHLTTLESNDTIVVVDRTNEVRNEIEL